MKFESCVRTDLIEHALCGGSVGALLFVIYDICLIAADLAGDSDMVADYVSGLATASIGGAFAFAAVSRLRNRKFAAADFCRGLDEWFRRDSNVGGEAIASVHDNAMAQRAKPNKPCADEYETDAFPFQP